MLPMLPSTPVNICVMYMHYRYEEELTFLIFGFQDLMTRVRQLESHVKQLRNVVLKGQGEGQVKKKAKGREFDFKK